MRSKFLVVSATVWLACAVGSILPTNASPFFSTGSTDGAMAAASRPDTATGFEIETGDDFALTGGMMVTGASFTGLLAGGATTSNIGQVAAEIYRVFPADSNVARTSGPNTNPAFSTPNVPTRTNSPSDNALASLSSGPNLSFTTNVLAPTFTATNSVLPGGISAKPMQTTGGNGAVTGQEVQFNLTFNTPFELAAGHYFFVPQVETTTGFFLWLSAPRPIVPPGTPFPAGFTDLQGWTRDAAIDPDWLRVGTDIVGGTTPPTFNFVFSLEGNNTPLPAALPLFATGLGGLGLLGWRRKRNRKAQA